VLGYDTALFGVSIRLRCGGRAVVHDALMKYGAVTCGSSCPDDARWCLRAADDHIEPQRASEKPKTSATKRRKEFGGSHCGCLGCEHDVCHWLISDCGEVFIGWCVKSCQAC